MLHCSKRNILTYRHKLVAASYLGFLPGLSLAVVPPPRTPSEEPCSEHLHLSPPPQVFLSIVLLVRCHLHTPSCPTSFYRFLAQVGGSKCGVESQLAVYSRHWRPLQVERGIWQSWRRLRWRPSWWRMAHTKVRRLAIRSFAIGFEIQLNSSSVFLLAALEWSYLVSPTPSQLCDAIVWFSGLSSWIAQLLTLLLPCHLLSRPQNNLSQCRKASIFSPDHYHLQKQQDWSSTSYDSRCAEGWARVWLGLSCCGGGSQFLGLEAVGREIRTKEATLNLMRTTIGSVDNTKPLKFNKLEFKTIVIRQQSSEQ